MYLDHPWKPPIQEPEESNKNYGERRNIALRTQFGISSSVNVIILSEWDDIENPHRLTAKD